MDTRLISLSEAHPYITRSVSPSPRLKKPEEEGIHEKNFGPSHVAYSTHRLYSSFSSSFHLFCYSTYSLLLDMVNFFLHFSVLLLSYLFIYFFSLRFPPIFLPCKLLHFHINLVLVLSFSCCSPFSRFSLIFCSFAFLSFFVFCFLVFTFSVLNFSVLLSSFFLFFYPFTFFFSFYCHFTFYRFFFFFYLLRLYLFFPFGFNSSFNLPNFKFYSFPSFIFAVLRSLILPLSTFLYSLLLSFLFNPLLRFGV